MAKMDFRLGARTQRGNFFAQQGQLTAPDDDVVAALAERDVDDDRIAGAQRRSQITLAQRTTGEGWRTTTLPVSKDGIARTQVGPMRGPLTQAALIGAIALRFPGQTLEWDNKGMHFKNHKEANAYVNPPYRKGWKL